MQQSPIIYAYLNVGNHNPPTLNEMREFTDISDNQLVDVLPEAISIESLANRTIFDNVKKLYQRKPFKVKPLPDQPYFEAMITKQRLIEREHDDIEQHEAFLNIRRKALKNGYFTTTTLLDKHRETLSDMDVENLKYYYNSALDTPGGTLTVIISREDDGSLMYYYIGKINQIVSDAKDFMNVMDADTYPLYIYHGLQGVYSFDAN